MRAVQHNSVPIPKILLSDEASRARAAVAEFLARSREERATRRPPYDEKLVHNREVLVAVHALFRERCAYCETQADFLDVEHHRPRANASGTRKQFPDHYCWLAYEWENLLLVCGPCNSRKASRFPVRGGRAPLLAELAQIRAQESPELIDPTYDRPERHLDFTLDGHCRPRTQRGKVTIDLLELNREDLLRTRTEAFRKFMTAARGAATTEEVLRVMLSLDGEAPHVGALLMLRHRYASALATLLEMPDFAFDDTVGILKKLHDEATRSVIATALTRVETPARPATPIAAQGWQGPSRTIRRVEIRNFKSILSLDLDFLERRPGSEASSSTMILGENATGKSTVLQAIALAVAGTDASKGLGRPPGQFVRRCTGEEEQQGAAEVTVFFLEGPAAELRILPGATECEGTQAPSATILAFGSRRLFLRGRRHTAPGAVIRSLFDPRWILPEHKHWLQKQKGPRFDEAARALRYILSLPDDSEFHSQAGHGVEIVAGDTSTPIKEHSDGYRSLFGLAIDVMQELRGSAPDLSDARGIVLIDEIETHLHPRWKMRVMSALRRALPRVQFIATTHDPLCLRGMEDGEVEVLVRDGREVRKLEGLPSVRGMRAEQLLTSEFFGLGTTDPETEAKLVRRDALLAKTARTPEESREKDLLERELAEDMKIGDILTDQIVSEALRRARIDPFQPIKKAEGRTRKELIEELLQRIREIEQGLGQPAA